MDRFAKAWCIVAGALSVAMVAYLLIYFGGAVSYKYLYEDRVKRTIDGYPVKIVELKDCYHYPSKLITCPKCGTEIVESGEKCK